MTVEMLAEEQQTATFGEDRATGAGVRRDLATKSRVCRQLSAEDLREAAREHERVGAFGQ